MDLRKIYKILMIFGVIVGLFLAFQVKTNWDNEKFQQSAAKIYDNSR